MADANTDVRVLMTLNDVAEYLRISYTAAKVRAREGNFPPHVRISDSCRGRRWRLEDVERWLEENLQTTA